MITLTTLTQSLTTAAETINRAAHAAEAYPISQADFENARDALHALAAQQGLATPFTDEGDIRSELDGDPVNRYRQAEKERDAARRDRSALLKSAAITAGAITGGLLTREAIRRGWGSRAVRKLTAAALTRKYGTLAGQAYQLIKDGRVTTILDEKTGVSLNGRCRLIKEGVAFTSVEGDGRRLAFSLDAVTGIEMALDHRGNIKYAILDLVDYINLDGTEEG